MYDCKVYMCLLHIHIFILLMLQDKDGRWRWWFWGYEQVYGKKFSCVSLQLEYKGLVPFLMKNADST